MEFSDEQREKAEEQVEDLRNGGEAYHAIAYDLQCRLNRAEKLLGQVETNPYLTQKIDQFLTALREEREP